MSLRSMAFCALLCASHQASAYGIYKSVDAEGNVTYSSSPQPSGGRVERVHLPPAPSQASVDEALAREQQIEAAGNAIAAERQARAREQAEGVEAARREVNSAQVALNDAKQIRDGDWQGTVQGKRHLKQEYFERVAAAAARLEAATQAYRQAR
ncbi:MAG: DUF4124 domain-containing protein [Gammaproteobacteria bacterium]|nr:DUF4124 domain-containing protein [Gammaproteobacteria bacterium]